MCVWDGAFDQPFWEREALQLAAEAYEPEEIDLAPGTEAPRVEGQGPHEPPMRRLEASRKAARDLWAEVQRWIRGGQRMIGLGVRAALALTVFCLLASPAEGQAASVEPDTVAALVAPYAKPHLVAQLLPDSALRKVWDRVVSCAGEQRDTSKTFEQLKFFQRDTVYLDGRVLKGEWVAPDSIFLTTGFEREGWVVAHEMLHHALNGPTNAAGDDPHVLGMAAFIACGLAEFQNRPPPAVLPPPLPRPEQSNPKPAAPYYRYRVTDPLTNRLHEPGDPSRHVEPRWAEGPPL